MPRPRIHDRATGEVLLDAAARLLHEGGPEAVSVRGVAEASGLSFRAVYTVFGSKEALVDALTARGYRSLTERVVGLPQTDDPARDLVVAGSQGFRGFAIEEPALFRLTFERVSREVLQQPTVVEAARASYDALVGWITRVREAELVHPDRSDLTCAFEFHSLCQGLASGELASQPAPGPGFWAMMRGHDMPGTWRDALTGLVAGFALPPEPGLEG
jgi:AcrR family transcriptional regulator